jgi:hypothetical protein
MLYEKLIRECVKTAGLFLTIQLLLCGCTKEEIAPPPIPQIKLVQSNYVISDTSSTPAFIELEASGFVGAYQFPVYFQIEGGAQPGVDFTIEHPVYTNADGVTFYEAIVAQGSRKSAVVIQPLNTLGGNKTLTIKVYPDQEKERYTLASASLTATLEIKDN